MGYKQIKRYMEIHKNTIALFQIGIQTDPPTNHVSCATTCKQASFLPLNSSLSILCTIIIVIIIICIHKKKLSNFLLLPGKLLIGVVLASFLMVGVIFAMKCSFKIGFQLRVCKYFWFSDKYILQPRQIHFETCPFNHHPHLTCLVCKIAKFLRHNNNFFNWDFLEIQSKNRQIHQMKNTNTRKQSKAERSNKSSGECWAVMKHLYPDQAAPNIRPDQPSHYYSATVPQYSSATNRQPVQGAHGTVHIVLIIIVG